MSTDFNDTIKNLNTAIGILRTNANHLAVMESDYKSMKQLSVDLLEKEEELEQAVNELKEGLFRKIDASVLHASQIAVGDGISFAEDNSYGLYNIDGSVTALLPALTADDATLQNATIDTANLSEIEKALKALPLVGVTTCPTIIVKEKRNVFDILKDIRKLIGDNMMLHAQVMADTPEGILRDAVALRNQI